MNSSGYLELLIGPMFAGKSSELIRLSKLYKVLGKNILIIHHQMDNRYSTTDIVTHNQTSVPATFSVDKLSSIHSEQIKMSDVILIDEIQFFPDALIMIKKWVDEDKKTVIVSGLDGDFMRRPFGDILQLIPLADKVRKLSALCMKCSDGTLAHFSQRKDLDIVPTGDQVMVVGHSDIYEAVCRKHYKRVS